MKNIATTVALLSLCGLVQAQDAGFYLGGSAGRSRTDFNSSDYAITLGGATLPSQASKTDTAYKLFAGYDFNRNWAVEGGYADFGEPDLKYTNNLVSGYARVKESSWFLVGKGTLNLDGGFSLFGKLGVTRNKSELSANSNSAFINVVNGLPWNRSENKNGVVYGVGAGYALGKRVGLRLEYENFGDFGRHGKSTGRTKADLWSLGLSYGF